jgi:predicted enzyme related to lactoylglutathione lyase
LPVDLLKPALHPPEVKSAMQTLINIDVPDLERAIRFYQEALGLRLGRRLFAGTVAEMLGAAAPIYLISQAEGSSPYDGASQPRGYRRHWTPFHLDFVVESLEAAIERAERAGASLEGAPQTFCWGRLARLSDPFGHGFCLLCWSDRGYDERA